MRRRPTRLWRRPWVRPRPCALVCRIGFQWLIQFPRGGCWMVPWYEISEVR